MTWLDTAVGWLSPQAGLRRAKARTVLHLLDRHTGRRKYEGAAVGRRTDGWVATGADANAEIYGARSRLVARARDLVRNNPYAAKAVTAWAANAVGEGIMPRSSPMVDTAWARWADMADADGVTDFYGLQTLIMRAVAESGEALILRRLATSAGMDVPLKLQVVEGDYLDNSRDVASTSSGGWIHQGIEYDARGNRLAYWLFRRHPGSMVVGLSRSFESRRVPAEDVLHIFDPQRAGQGRGVTWFAPAIVKLKDLDDYEEAELVRKKIEACFVAFVFGDDDDSTLGASETDEDGRRVETFSPGMVNYLPGTKSVQFGEPKANGGYRDYMLIQLHAIAAAMGLTYELLTGDLSMVNFSSARVGLIEFRRRIRQLQKQVLLPQLLLPVWQWWSELAQSAGVIPDGDRVPVAWTFPRFESVQPLQDAQEETMRLRNGTLSLPEAVAARGYDFNDTVDEIAAANKLLDRKKIILDSDPRKTNKSGALQAKPGAQQPKPNGAAKPPNDKDAEDDNADGDEGRLMLAALAEEIGVKLPNGHG